MQFHVNGFRPGDPRVADPVEALPPPAPERSLPGDVDVLVVGSGPAGLTLAAQLVAFPELTVCIVEAKPGALQLGQADGIACRTMEMFQAFGFADRVANEGYWVNETVFWKPDPDASHHIRRSDRIQDVEDGLSEMPHVILNQARVHDLYLERMRHAPSALVPHYGRRLTDVAPPAAEGDPVVARFERTDGEGEIETVRARYVVGCDGARSQVRRSIGRELVGDVANQAWGVMDVLAVTDFPDIRFKCIVHSNEGNIIVIPREGGYLVRLYVELGKLRTDERVASRDITVEQLIAAAGRILAPYSIAVREVAWWSVYEIGQRLCERFDDVPVDRAASGLPRVFIAGDACHTHSPKAGQGMNVSMQDSLNLGWKLASVLRGQCRPELLRSYSEERYGVAKQLIDFDRELSAMMGARPKSSPDDDEGVDPVVFQRYFQQHGRFTAGVATRYRPSVLTGTDAHQHHATGFGIGARFHSAPVIRLADAKPLQLGHVVEADGRWRLFVFGDADRPDAPDSRLAALCRFLQDDPRSPVVRFTASDADIDSRFDVRAVLQQSHHTLSLNDVPPLLRPTKGRLGLVDHEKVFCADLAGPDIFDLRGVDRDGGALVVVRPDQYVAHVLTLDALDELAAFFETFMIPTH